MTINLVVAQFRSEKIGLNVFQRLAVLAGDISNRKGTLEHNGVVAAAVGEDISFPIGGQMALLIDIKRGPVVGLRGIVVGGKLQFSAFGAVGVRVGRSLFIVEIESNQMLVFCVNVEESRGVG